MNVTPLELIKKKKTLLLRIKFKRNKAYWWWSLLIE